MNGRVPDAREFMGGIKYTWRKTYSKDIFI